MTIKTVAQILDSVQGVWEGTYAHHKPDGTLIDKYADEYWNSISQPALR